MDKEDVVCVYINNEILFKHKKVLNNAICSNMDGPTNYYTNHVSQKEKDKYHMISLYVESKPWHKWTYLYNRNTLTNIETCGCQGEGGWWWDGVGGWD